MTLRNRLQRLEATSTADAGRCPECPQTLIVLAGEPVPLCDRCGRPPPDLVEIQEVVIETRDDARRLREGAELIPFERNGQTRFRVAPDPSREPGGDS